MAYGLLVNSGNSTVQIDSARPMCYLKPVQMSSGNVVTVADQDELIFIKPPSFPNATRWGLTPGTTSFNITSNGTQTATDYLTLRATSVGGASSTGYGLQVFNVDGNLAFDSEIFTGATGIKVPYLSKIIDINGVYGASNIIYTGADYDQIYACVNGSISTTASISIHTFIWEQATTTIKYVSQIAASSPFPGYTYYNQSTILLVKLI
jgi:hypothetical protein